MRELAHLLVGVMCLGTGLLAFIDHSNFLFALDISLSALNLCLWYEYLSRHEQPMLENEK